MATTDSELIDEVKAFTGYTDNDFTDSQVQDLLDIGKEEIKATLNRDSLTLYTSDTHDTTRALFWFTCIATKVRAGEIGSVNLNIDDVLEYSDIPNEYSFWFDNLRTRLIGAEGERGITGASSVQIERDARSYPDSR